MTAITCVDDRDTAIFASYTRRTLFVVAHSDDVGKRADYTNGVRYCLAFAYATALGIREAKYITAQLHHGSCEAETGTGARFVEECSEFLAMASLGVHLLIINDIQCAVDDHIYLGSGKIWRVD
jgi:hypothetical protein